MRVAIFHMVVVAVTVFMDGAGWFCALSAM